MATAKAAKAKPVRAARSVHLKMSSEPWREQRFVPKLAGAALATLLLSSFGFLLLGAGAYGRFLHGIEAHPYSLHLLIGGSVLSGIGLFLGRRPPLVARVGETGIATEGSDGTLARIRWSELDSVQLAQGTLTFTGAGRIVAFDLATLSGAAAAALAEARKRRPNKVEHISETLTTTPQNSPTRLASSSWVAAEPIQIAGERCKNSGKIISLEKDGRFCAQCSEAYHKDSLPQECLSCGVSFRG